MSLDTATIVWLVIAIVSAIAEIMIPHFGLIFVAIAAGAAALTAAIMSMGVGAQLLIFAVAVVGSFAIFRPLVLRKIHGPGVPGRTEVLIGRAGVVTEPIDPVSGTGRVNIGGQDWAARSGSTVAAGTQIKVVGADGIVLEVRPA